MKKALPIIVIVIVIIAAGAYIGRHKIKSMLGMAPTQAPMQGAPHGMTTGGSMAPSTNSAMQSATAPSNNIYQTKTDATKGKYMTDFQGMTLYTYDKDTAGVSNCYNGCAKAWPVYTSGATAEKMLPENITVITRKDGTKQFAWKGMPLYYYVQDTKAGDITGDGVGGVWHIVKM